MYISSTCYDKSITKVNSNLLVKTLLVAISFPIVVVATAMQMASAQQPSYHMTVFISSHRFGVNSVNVRVTFSIPPNEGNTIRVCVADEIVGTILGSGNCQDYSITGQDMQVTQDAGQMVGLLPLLFAVLLTLSAQAATSTIYDINTKAANAFPCSGGSSRVLQQIQ